MKKKWMFLSTIAIALTLGGELQAVNSVVQAQEVQQRVKNVKQVADFNPKQYADEIESFFKKQEPTDLQNLFSNILVKEKSDIEKYGEVNTDQIKMLWGSYIFFDFGFVGDSKIIEAIKKSPQAYAKYKKTLNINDAGPFLPNTESKAISIKNNEDGSNFTSYAYYVPHNPDVTNENADKTVITYDGFRGGYDINGNATEDLKLFYDKGYNILNIDNRATSLSGGDYVTFGQYESDDVLAWVNHYLKEKPDQKIVLYGVSMGASTMMSVLAKDYPSNIKGVIENCGYKNIREEISYVYTMAATLGISYINERTGADFANDFAVTLGNKTKMLETINDYYIKPKANVDIDGNLPVNGIKASHLPVLFIHGEADVVVPVSNGKDLYEIDQKDNDNSRALFVPEAEHGEAILKDHDGYFKAVYDYLDMIF